MVPMAPAISDARSESSRNEHVAQSSNDGTDANADIMSMLCLRSRVDAECNAEYGHARRIIAKRGAESQWWHA